MQENVIGSFLSELRRQKGLKQREVAEAILVSDKAVSRWETGRGIPDVTSLERLSDFYGVSINEILAGKRLNVEEIGKVADVNLRNMGRQASSLRIKLVIAMIGMAGLLISLIAVITILRKELEPEKIGIMISQGKGYSVVDMDQFFQAIDYLDSLGEDYEVSFDTRNKTINLSVIVYEGRETMETLENFDPNEIKKVNFP